MRLLFLCNYFPPEIGSGPHLPFELAESLARHGHNVTVVTGFPRYNVPRLPRKYRWHLFLRERMSGIDVHRVEALNFHGHSRLGRVCAQFVSPLLLAARALALPKHDVVYTITPPLMMGLAATVVAHWFGAPSVVTVWDLVPQAYIDLGKLRSSILIRGFAAMESCVYRSATAITVNSQGNRTFVAQRGAPSSSVHVVPNWVDTVAIKPSGRMNAFRAQHGIGSEFVVQYAGTMGHSQDIEILIEAARLLQADPGLLFMLVGDGVAKPGLQVLAGSLANVRFLPMQPRETYPSLLAAADVCFISLRAEVATPAMPAKIASIMAAGRPMLAALPPGDAMNVIAESGAGRIVQAGDLGGLVAAIRDMRDQPTRRREMGESGRRYAQSRLSLEACVAQVDALFRDVSNPVRAQQ